MFSRNEIKLVLIIGQELQVKGEIEKDGVLKELLLDQDRRLEAALQLFNLTDDREDFVNTLIRLAKSKPI